MASNPLRRLSLEGRTFLWRRAHKHTLASPPSGGGPGEPHRPHRPRVCHERVVVYLEGKKRSPLEVFFDEDATWQVGYPQSGALFRAEPLRVYDLHRPGVIAALALHGLATGWEPETAHAPLVVRDGFAFLEAARAPTGFAGPSAAT